jgi:hypothetical protein
LERLGRIQGFEILGCRIDFRIDSGIFYSKQRGLNIFKPNFELVSKYNKLKYTFWKVIKSRNLEIDLNIQI